MSFMGTTPKIGIQGIDGSYSSASARNYFGGLGVDSVDLRANESFSDVFQGVELGYYDFGVVAIYNSIGGVVDAAAIELAHRPRIQVLGERYHGIEHCLVAHPESRFDPDDLDMLRGKVITSHEQALRQVALFSEEYGMIPKVHADTAGSIRDLVGLEGSSRDINDMLAVGPRDAAKLYGGRVVVGPEDLMNEGNNVTRFFVISRKNSEASNGLLELIGGSVSEDNPKYKAAIVIEGSFNFETKFCHYAQEANFRIYSKDSNPNRNVGPSFERKIRNIHTINLEFYESQISDFWKFLNGGIRERIYEDFRKKTTSGGEIFLGEDEKDSNVYCLGVFKADKSFNNLIQT